MKLMLWLCCISTVPISEFAHFNYKSCDFKCSLGVDLKHLLCMLHVSSRYQFLIHLYNIFINLLLPCLFNFLMDRIQICIWCWHIGSYCYLLILGEDASETASQSDSIPPPQLSPHPAPITGRSNSAQPRSSPHKSPGRGRGRGRGRPRIHRTVSEPHPLSSNQGNSVAVKEKSDRTVGKMTSPGKSSESTSKHSSPDKSTPSGVGRRTAVLFSKKAANRGGSTPRRVGRPPKRAASLDVPANTSPRNPNGGLNVETEFNKNLPASIPEHGATLRKRARSLSYSQDKSKSPTKQQSENELANGFDPKAPSGESFTVYRTEHLTRSSSDSESSVSSHSSGVPTDSSSGEEDRQSRRHRHGVNFTEDSSGDTSCGESTSTNSRFNVRSKAGGPVLRDRERRGMNKWPAWEETWILTMGCLTPLSHILWDFIWAVLARVVFL